MIKARRVGHATFETTDLDKMIDYYTQVMGLVLSAREKNRAFLASKIGLLSVQLDLGSVSRLKKLSFEVPPGSDYNDMAKKLSSEGIKSEQRSDSIPGMGKVLAFDDPKGTTIELFSEWSYLGKHMQHHGVGPLKLGHIAYVVDNPEAIAEFYCKVLGFRVSDWIEDFFVFLRCNPDHHTVNFVRGDRREMHHIAFELKDFAHMQNACELFAQRKIHINWGPVRHGPGHNVAIYHRNADGQVVEFYFELDQMKDEELGYFDPKPWHHDQPLRPKVWDRHSSPNLWGPLPTPDFRREYASTGAPTTETAQGGH
jgi:catechol 2,3-dioxygenase-like lactoylglutathione lyase family enzyme